MEQQSCEGDQETFLAGKFGTHLHDHVEPDTMEGKQSCEQSDQNVLYWRPVPRTT